MPVQRVFLNGDKSPDISTFERHPLDSSSDIKQQSVCDFSSLPFAGLNADLSLKKNQSTHQNLSLLRRLNVGSIIRYDY